MKKFEVKDVCFFDCETTGVPAKGLEYDKHFEQFPHVVSLAWAFGENEKMYIIKPEGWEIPVEVVEIHGITTERALAEGVPFDVVVDEFLTDAAAAPLVCAHNIYFDSSMIKADILRVCGREYYDQKAENALFKGKRIDTMMKTIKFVGACFENGRPGKFPKLEELYAKLFDGATFEAHNALEDVRALRRCVPELVNLGIIELVQKEYPAEQLKIQPATPGRKIEFSDPNPVTVPVGCPDLAPARPQDPEPTPDPATKALLEADKDEF